MRLIKDKPTRILGESLNEFAKRSADWMDEQAKREQAKEQLKDLILEARIALRSPK
jgi:hypothetical protein